MRGPFAVQKGTSGLGFSSLRENVPFSLAALPEKLILES